VLIAYTVIPIIYNNEIKLDDIRYKTGRHKIIQVSINEPKSPEILYVCEINEIVAPTAKNKKEALLSFHAVELFLENKE
jgi:hypothetical protein